MNRPNDEPKKQPGPPTSTSPLAAALSRGLKFKLAALGLTLVSALAGTGLAYWLKTPPRRRSRPRDRRRIPARLFPDWGKPDLVVLLSAQQHGYMLPCGCSKPQVGGLERVITSCSCSSARLAGRRRRPGRRAAEARAGQPAQRAGTHQVPLLDDGPQGDGLSAVGVGEYEAALSLVKIEGEWALNKPEPAVLGGNLEKAAISRSSSPWEVVAPGTTTSRSA